MQIGSTKGKLLVAAPALLDPNFDRTVILMLEHNAEGALGLVLNRPSDVDVAEGFEAWVDWSRPPACLFVGGPVQPEAAFCVALLGADDVRTTAAEGLAPIVARLAVADLERTPMWIPAEIEAARIFCGYAGWTGGQLERELREEAWFVVDAEDDDVFAPEPSALWHDVLRRQPGTLQWVANFPDDPQDN
ncbi:MAG TPA: YqgE/AlgH family protein [Acidimicrobiia bacterium]